MVNWGAIRKEWETTKITIAVLAEKHDVKFTERRGVKGETVA